MTYNVFKLQSDIYHNVKGTILSIFNTALILYHNYPGQLVKVDTDDTSDEGGSTTSG